MICRNGPGSDWTTLIDSVRPTVTDLGSRTDCRLSALIAVALVAPPPSLA